MRAWLWISVVFLSIAFGEEAVARRPNILWIVGENLSHDLGCYGAKHVATPNLDRLASQGTRFTQVFSTNPACAPSRSAFMLGMYQTTTDTHHMRSHRDDDFRLPAGVQPLTHRLRDAGYFTANIKTIGEMVVGTGKLDLNFVNEGPIYAGENWSDLKSKQPFFAQVNCPEVEYDIYDRQTFKKERVLWVGEAEHPQIAKPENVSLPPYYPDHPVVREEWARFLNSVSGMDQRIGRVLMQLEADGLSDDTIVVFFADNGRLEPRGIHWCYDNGLRVPMIIRWPKNFTAPKEMPIGGVDDRLLSLIDVTATTLRLASIAPPLGMQGRDLLADDFAAGRSYVFAARDRIDETVQRIRSVHSRRFHYIRTFSSGPIVASLNRYKEKCFPIQALLQRLYQLGQLTGPAKELMDRRGPCEELYDLLSDPWEIDNLINSSDPAHREALAAHRIALETWVIESGDRGGLAEPQEIAQGVEQEMANWFGTPAWAPSK
jgi:N-sulfoglucosamine sulfohydrolase